MTVKELIEMLKTCDEKSKVLDLFFNGLNMD